MRKFFAEFKAFALRGNVMNLAVGVIIGAAFQSVVTSLTDNILSPIIGLFTGRDFGEWYVTLFDVELKYGAFLTSLVNFIIMAFVVFLLVRLMNRLLSGKKPAPEAAPATRECPFCTSQISIRATRCPHCTSAIDN